ncbi:substrate-binding domain-containing protein [Fimbriimonas ginsengisoli]|uniref:Putative L-rhamnose ABC transporter, substrate-binding component n=1 Tax=Fimbriimonas ginsengisoli Gsoil 348 TaxID=661478 RepID=A0A068NPR4_FIMGI|nr:substrate-binding domain-containing protein [Fimbriimonas ginsengisoli]AIE85436.1 putative L-rhamnose ABC transporter, substrate-binding component [Fimbriimonas ginsengisoli Gsoil 348]
MKLRAFAFLLFPTLVLAGCGSSDSGSGSTGTTGGTASKESSGAKLKIVYIPKNEGNPYFNEVKRGFEDAAKELGADFTEVGPATGEATSQIPIIKQQIQQGVDVIAISPNSPDALNTVLDQAKTKGITVITVDADLDKNETHRDAAVLPADFDQIGSSQVELLGKLTGYEGEFAILSATTDAPNQNAWIAKMKETLKDPKFSKMKLVETVFGDDKDVKSTTETEGLLAKHPGLRGIIAPTSVGLAAAAPVIERTGVFPGGPHAVGKGLQLTGLSTPNQLKKFVNNGVVTSFQLWAPYNEGYLATYLGSQIHTKKLTPTAGATFDTPKFGKQKLSDKLVVIGGPLVTFDKSNIDKSNF